MGKTPEKYFLASNSALGFYSQFSSCYSPENGWRAFVIKGGPGTGKSSLMKYTAAVAEKKSIPFILCPCSSDPDSLDAVIFPSVKTVILDGTPPHTVEPRLPGVCEEIINLGEFWESDKLLLSAEKIMEATRENKAFHSAASRYIYACGQLVRDSFKAEESALDYSRIQSFSKRLCHRYLKPKKEALGFEWIRFLSGITPKGYISYTNTITKNYQNLIILSDMYGAAANRILSEIRREALSCGYEIITLKNAFLPDEILEHILIPELSLAFVTENDFIRFDSKARRIHTSRFANKTVLSALKRRFSLNRRLLKELLNGAVSSLKSAKSSHDMLEKHYIEAMDFERHSFLSVGVAKKIFK